MRPSDVWVDASNVDKADVRTVLSSLIAGAKAYGAVGDGMTDDRSAIASLDAANPGAVHFPAGSYLVKSDLTIAAPCHFDNGAKLSADSGVTITLSKAPVAGRNQIFDGDGDIVIAESCVAYPEWWGTDSGAAQRALAGTFAGSRIEFPAGITETTGLVFDGTRDKGKQICGVGGPSDRGMAAPQTGAILKLADGSDTDIIKLDFSSGSPQRMGVLIENITLDGNKANNASGHGINIQNVNELYFGLVVIRNCAGNGINTPTGGGNNNIHGLGILHITGCGGKGFQGRSVGDSSFWALFIGQNTGDGAEFSQGNTEIGYIRAYLNGGVGVEFSGSASAGNPMVGKIRANNNGGSGVLISNSLLQVGTISTYNNGQNTGLSNGARCGVQIQSPAGQIWIGSIDARDDQGTPTQQYHVRSISTVGNVRIGHTYFDGNAGVREFEVSAAASTSGLWVGFPPKQDIAYASSVTINPALGTTAYIGDLTGNITIANINTSYLYDGLEVTIWLKQDGTGGRTISWGSRWRPVTAPSTTAGEITMMRFVARGQILYEIAGQTGMTA